MARTDLVLSLIKASAIGDQAALRRTVEAMAAEERQKQHHTYADQLLQYLEAFTQSRRTNEGPSSAPDLVTEVVPRRLLSDLTLTPATEEICREFIEEQLRAELLRSHGVEPRNRLLLIGPPGNGKTSLAEAIAAEISIPLLRVRYDSLITSFLGETAVRLSRLFDFVRTRRCAVFFDEFDAIAKERGDEHEIGEIKRIVSSLLLNLDQLPSYVVVIVATNHPELLDRAAWRRFQTSIVLDKPTLRQILQWIRRFELHTGLHLRISESMIIRKLKGASFADVEELCRDVQRRTILDGADASVSRIALQQLEKKNKELGIRRAANDKGDV